MAASKTGRVTHLEQPLLPPSDGSPQPSPHLMSSDRPSEDLSRSQERLLPKDIASTAFLTTQADSVPYAPPQLHRVTAENPAQPKLITDEVLRDHPEYGDLTFWPWILSKTAVGLLVLLYAITAGAIGVLVWRNFRDPDHSFRMSSENVRLISRYFPSIIGTITVVLFRQTVREALRMEPFINMADQNGCRNHGISPAEGVGGAWFPWQSLTTAPLSFLSVSSIVVQFFVSFIVSFKVALLASTEHSENEEHFWILTVRLWPAMFLIIIYIFMIAYTVFLSFRTRRKSTGLKWDPVSIADYASLFAHCNALKYFAPLELRHNLRPGHVMPADRQFRIGYWTRKQDNPEQTDIVYGIGVKFDMRQDSDQSDDADRLIKYPLGRPWYHMFQRHKSMPNPVESCRLPKACAHGTWPKCEHYPYRENPGCSRWTIFLFSIFPVAVLGLSIYALVIKLPVNGFSVPNNFKIPSNVTLNFGRKNHTISPVDPIDPYSNVLLWALILRSAPTYVAGIFTSTVVTWIDLNMRFMQPFRNMFGNEPDKSFLQRCRDYIGWKHQRISAVHDQTAAGQTRTPASAAESILLAYLTQSPLSVPLTAWNKGHYKVCIYSTLNTISPLFPIFVGGLLTVTPTPTGQQVECTFSLSAYIGIMVFAVLYSLLLPIAIPGAYRLLPRQLYSLADLMVLCHESKFMSSPHLNIANRERTPTKEHMQARILLTDDHFLFGRYTGRDGRKHIGFDVTQRREDDFGTRISLPDPVEHIPPEGLSDAFHRTRTSAMEQGKAVARTMTGWTANKENPFSQRNKGIIENDQVYEMSGAITTSETESSGPIQRNVAEMASGNTLQANRYESRSRFGGQGAQSSASLGRANNARTVN